MIDVPEWYFRASCQGRDTRMFYSEPDPGQVVDLSVAAIVRAAKAVCADCPVQQTCLMHSLEHNEKWGIWGGVSERERRRVRRKWLAAGRPTVWTP